MYKILFIFSLLFPLLFAKSQKPKHFHAQERTSHYRSSLEREESHEEEIFSSSAEISSEITFSVSLQATTEGTSEHGHNMATMSFLDRNRLQITEEIAQGNGGEFLTTLLHSMNIQKTTQIIAKLQEHFSELIELKHGDFLTKIESFS